MRHETLNACDGQARQKNLQHTRAGPRRANRWKYQRLLGWAARRAVVEMMEARVMLSGTITVTTLDDSVDPNDNVTSLREAVAVAAPNDTIGFAPSLTAGGPVDLVLSRGEIVINTAMTIQGPSGNALGISGNNVSRIFRNTASDVTIKNLRLLRGKGGFSGGAIYNERSLTLADCTLTSNSAFWGGAIENYSGDLFVTDSTFEDNTSTSGGGAAVRNYMGLTKISGSTFSGNNGTAIDNRGDEAILIVDNSSFDSNTEGGIDNQSRLIVRDVGFVGNTGNAISNQGQLEVLRSIFERNQARAGAGVYNWAATGTVTITDSTFFNNSVTEFGGAVFQGGSPMTILNSTFSGNSAAAGAAIYRQNMTGGLTVINSTIYNNQSVSGAGGIQSSAWDTVLLNTIVSGNHHGVANDDLWGGFDSSSSNNLLGIVGGPYGPPSEHNILGVINPKLAPLADNGGPTPTHALLPGSPANDAGGNSLVPATLTGDQRGNTRVMDGNGDGVAVVDIGAYECPPLPPATPLRTDHRWVAADHAQFGSELPSGTSITVSIKVDRVVGDVAKLKAAGTQYARLRIPAFDVDRYPGAGRQPEVIEIYFNGKKLDQDLTGWNNAWYINSVQVPIEWVNFPSDPGPGATLTPASNSVEFRLDTKGGGWSQALYWVSLEVDWITPPVLLVHGMNAGPEGWETVWIPELRDRGILSYAIGLGNQQGTIFELDSMQQNASDIAGAVDSLVYTSPGSPGRWGVDKINIVTHSKGGVDSRHYVEDSNRVAALIQIAAPNFGSPLATHAQLAIGLLGPLAPPTQMLAGPGATQLTPDYMARYNLVHGRNPDVNYYTLAGNYKFGGFWGSILDALIQDLVYFGDSDLVVPTWSVPLPWAKQNLLFSTTGDDENAKHTKNSESLTVFKQLEDSLQVGSGGAGSMLATAALIADSEPGPAAVAVGKVAGALAAGASETQTLAIDGAGNVRIALMKAGGQFQFTLVSPSGRVIDPTTAEGDPNIDYAVTEDLTEDALSAHFMIYEMRGSAAEKGLWKINVTANAVTQPSGYEPYLVSGLVDSAPIAMTVELDPEFHAVGDPIRITATLTSSVASLAGASVTASLRAPDGSRSAIFLVDDGSAGDSQAGDGKYTATLMGALAGTYQLSVTASGTAPQPFSRSELLLTSVSNAHVDITSSSDAGVDSNSNGLYDQLQVNLKLSTDAAARYRIIAELHGGNDELVGFRSEIRELPAGTNQQVPLSFGGEAIYRRGVDGPYRLVLRISQEDEIDILPVFVNEDVASTGAYSYRDFERPPVVATGSILDSATDVDGAPGFDWLVVSPELDVTTAGKYSWSGMLVDPEGAELGYAYGAGWLVEGVSRISFGFDGSAIGASRRDGPYRLINLMIEGPSGPLLIDEAGVTSAYRASQFAGYVDCPPLMQPVANATVDEGTLVTLTPVVTDDDTPAELLTFSLGPGAPVGAAIDPGTGVFTFIAAEGPADVTVTVVVTDDTSLSDSKTFAIHVNNRPPVITHLQAHPDRAVTWQPVRFSAGFTDPGLDDAHSVRWDFGDNSPVEEYAATDPRALHPTHVYAAGGTFTVTLMVIDDEGAQSSATHLLRVDSGAMLSGSELLVVGTTGNDNLHVSPAAGGKTNVFIGGRLVGAFAASRVIVYGGPGSDVLDATESLNIPVEFHGGPGNDLLRGGMADDLLFGDEGDDRMEARKGNDILVGGPGNDVLRGVQGWDIVIGGTGADWLFADEQWHAGGQDLLITGSTIYDNDVAALETLRAEWTRSAVDYTVRIANLAAGVAGGTLFLRANESVQNDGDAVDWIFAYGERDWFFASRNDKITDQRPDEQVVWI